MTSEQIKSRLSDIDAQDDKAAEVIVAAGCMVITLAWLAVLAHWASLL